MRWTLPLLALAVALNGCTLFETRPEPPERPQPEPITPAPVTPPSQPPVQPPSPPAPTLPALPTAPEPAPASPSPPTPPVDLGKPQPVAMPWLKKAEWADLPGWRQDDLAQAWGAFQQSCRGLRSNPSWIPVCQAAARLPAQPETWQVRQFLEQRFQPWQSNQAEGGVEGLITGYYEPLLRGSRSPSPKYPYPLRSPPEDMLVIDLASVYPELKSLRLRGRIQGNKVVPYYTRNEIETGAAPLPGKELVWVDDAVELFFLQVQGSGRVQFENGEVMRVGYADQNGHPYRSIGKWLVEKGELTLDKASMQGIKDWGRRNPHRLAELLNSNPSYVYFRELPGNGAGPLGALGVPLTGERSIAVDPRGVPLGAPVWLATTLPNSTTPLQRLMLAQDTGGAIRGNVRADFFWGFGDEAGKQAGAMKQRGRMWVLLPKDYPILTP